MTSDGEVEADRDEAGAEVALPTAEAVHVADPSAPPPRLGNVRECPVCGSAVAPGAYHCPTCQNSFCFHCRARVLPSDVQLQCVNQRCAYYGKLLCDVCEDTVVEEQPPAVYMEPEEGFWPLLLLVDFIAFGFVWYQSSFGWAALFLFLAFPALGYAGQVLGLNVFGRERRVEHRRTAEYYRCICCRKAVKELAMPSLITSSWQTPTPRI